MANALRKPSTPPTKQSPGRLFFIRDLIDHFYLVSSNGQFSHWSDNPARARRFTTAAAAAAMIEQFPGWRGLAVQIWEPAAKRAA
jgi:hypothetical protein